MPGPIALFSERPGGSGGSSGASAWGAITGTLSDQTDLQTALNLKVNTSALGTAAYSASTDFATAAQGLLAASAAQLAFKTISVSGQSDVVADTATDTLTLVAGSGITITTDAAADSITIASSGGAAWSSITAAVADGSTNNGTNRIVYNVAPTADSRIAWRFTESTAASSGTSTSGVPNQVLLQIDTIASSTQSPLKVLSRGLFVFAVSPTARQVLFTAGTTAAPSVAFSDATNYGLTSGSRFGGGRMAIAANGQQPLTFYSGGNATDTNVATQYGASNQPALTFNDAGGFFSDSGSTFIGLATGGWGSSIENTRWTSAVQQVSKGSADAVSYAINGRKSRGSVASPTVITTGDDLLTISGFGYVGATNTYQEACRITFDSTGTISDSATGIGGIMRFLTAKVGAEPTEIMRLTTGTTTGGGWLTMDEADANPGTGDLVSNEEFAMYRKADKLVFAYNAAGTMNYLVFTLDGATTTFTNSTTAP